MSVASSPSVKGLELLRLTGQCPAGEAALMFVRESQVSVNSRSPGLNAPERFGCGAYMTQLAVLDRVLPTADSRVAALSP
ncbi:MAG: hypothetical protein L0K07_04315 [Yaniella sp.]|nr:hypothetical protein [Yaniella sp.]